MQNIIKTLPNTTYQRMIKIIFGAYDKDFNHYIKNEGNLSDKQYATKLFEFFNVDREDFKREVSSAFLSTGYQFSL